MTPAFFEKVQASYPEAVALMLGYFSRQHELLTAKKPALDYEQHLVLLALAGADEKGMWQSRFSSLSQVPYRIITMFEKGLMNTASLTMDQVLETAQEFFSMIEKTYTSTSS